MQFNALVHEWLCPNLKVLSAGVPPTLLGIRGQATFSCEARLLVVIARGVLSACAKLLALHVFTRMPLRVTALLAGHCPRPGWATPPARIGGRPRRAPVMAQLTQELDS